MEVPEPDASPPAVNLVAYASDHFPAGTVVDNHQFEPLAVASDDQVGAIRWWPGTGQIHQIYVQPHHRRQGIATALVYAASAHLKGSGSRPVIWASGDRTDLGEALARALARALAHPQRTRPRRSVAPPMTPDDQTVGVPARNLFPAP